VFRNWHQIKVGYKRNTNRRKMCSLLWAKRAERWVYLVVRSNYVRFCSVPPDRTTCLSAACVYSNNRYQLALCFWHQWLQLGYVTGTATCTTFSSPIWHIGIKILPNDSLYKSKRIITLPNCEFSFPVSLSHRWKLVTFQALTAASIKMTAF
jgi:hypothetical protein